MSIDVDSFTISEIIEQEREIVPFGPWHRQWLLERAPEKVRRNLERARDSVITGMARQGFASMDTNDVNTAAFAAVVSTSAEANIVGSSASIINQFCAIPANDARAGKLYEVKATALARLCNGDDVLFFLHDHPFPLVVVHLTFTGKLEKNPLWPTFRPFESLDAWIRRAMQPDIAQFQAVHSKRSA